MKKFKGHKKRKTKENYGKHIVIMLAALMVLSTLGYLVGQNNSSVSSVTYNGYAIEVTQYGLRVTIDDKETYFTYYPDTVAYLKPDEQILNLVKNSKVITVVYDPEEDNPEMFGGVQYQLEQDFVKDNKFVIRGLTKSEGYNLPELDCVNATATVPVLKYMTGNATGYKMEGNCIIAEGIVPSDMIQLKDALIYGYYGVI